MGRSAMIALALATSLLAACAKTFEYEWNQRVTVVVETPDGEVSGSGVIRAYFYHGQTRWGSDTTWRTLAGEYPVIDLGDGRYLVAVMRAIVTIDTDKPAPWNPGYGALVFAKDQDRERYSRVEAVRSLRQAPRDEPRPLIGLPLFVTFDDPNDPLTIRRVDSNEFENMFGPGYALKAVTIELTDDPPTEGAMREAFPWLVDLWREGTLLDGDQGHRFGAEHPLANSLGPLSFTMERFEAAD